MKTITETINLYTFEELSEKAKEKVKESERDHLYNIHCEDVDDVIYQCLYEYGLEEAKFSYDLSHCQGDGVCFYNVNLFDYFRMTSKDNNKRLNKFEFECSLMLNEKEYKMLLQYLNEGYNIKIVKGTSRYAHSYTCSLEEEFYYSDNKEEENAMNDFIYDLRKKMEMIYHNMCYEMERLGYNYIENITEDEIMDEIDYLEECCGVMFLEDGTYYYGG